MRLAETHQLLPQGMMIMQVCDLQHQQRRSIHTDRSRRAHHIRQHHVVH